MKLILKAKKAAEKTKGEIMKEEFIAGRNPVAEALRSGRALNKVMVQDGARGVTEIIAAARKKGVAVEFVKSDKLDKLAQGVRHQAWLLMLRR